LYNRTSIVDAKNIEVTGTTTLSGNTTIAGTLAIQTDKLVVSADGNTSIGGTFGVSGTTTLSGNTTIAGTLGVTGNVTFDERLTVSEFTKLQGSVYLGNIVGSDSSGGTKYPSSTIVHGQFAVKGNYSTAVGILAGTSAGSNTTGATCKFHCYHKPVGDSKYRDIKHFASVGSGLSDGWNGFDDVSTNGVLNFTGQHRTHETKESGSLDSFVGCIVVSSGICDNIRINESLPRVELSSAGKDKRCFGVVSDKEDPNETQRTYSHGFFQSHFDKGEKESKIIINSLGEGAIWVCNENGPLENGDYITTSNQAGLGMKQDEVYLANFTVAKVTMSCDFEPKMIPKKTLSGEYDDIGRPLYNYDENDLVPEYEVITRNDGIKQAFVSCTYHCG